MANETALQSEDNFWGCSCYGTTQVCGTAFFKICDAPLELAKHAEYFLMTHSFYIAG